MTFNRVMWPLLVAVFGLAVWTGCPTRELACVAPAIGWCLALGSLVWMALQLCDVVRDHYLMHEPWRPGKPWTRADGRLAALPAGLLMLALFGPSAVALQAATAFYVVLAAFCLRLGLRVRLWWHSAAV